MLEFIKMFGLGVFYTLISPILLVIFVLSLIYAFFNYLVIEVASVFGFFFGYDFSKDTKLDVELRKLKEANKEESNAEETSINREEVKEADGDE